MSRSNASPTYPSPNTKKASRSNMNTSPTSANHSTNHSADVSDDDSFDDNLEEMMVIDINFAKGKSDEIIVHFGDQAVDLAEASLINMLPEFVLIYHILGYRRLSKSTD
jgi:hypothetical protein